MCVLATSEFPSARYGEAEDVLRIPSWLKRTVRGALSRTPYQVIRGATNRFDAIEHCQRQLAKFGFRPKVVIDGGAHLGTFATMAAKVFPQATIHMIEPQPSCHPALQRLPHVLHAVALGSENGRVRMNIADSPDTGAHVWETGGVEVPMSRLDTLIPLRPGDRAFLKLDLQGYEIEALEGAQNILEHIEVILSEVSFFVQAHEPPVARLIAYLDERGFELFDIAALGGRTRDDRLKAGDFVFVRRGSPISTDTAWG